MLGSGPEGKGRTQNKQLAAFKAHHPFEPILEIPRNEKVALEESYPLRFLLLLLFLLSGFFSGAHKRCDTCSEASIKASESGVGLLV
jgi:hypothetical protein